MPQRFDRARGERVIRFARSLQPDLVINNRTATASNWSPIGKDHPVTFAPVTGQRVRLNLLKTTEGPSIWEFNLFETKMK